MKKLTQEQAHAKWVAVHGDRYDYTDTIYVKSSEYICVRCKEHDYIFEITHNDHIMGGGCNICSGNRKSNTEDFISKSKQIHGERYDYSLVKYTNAKTKVKVICKEHGVFEITPNDHLSSKGCRRCDTPVTNTQEFIEAANKVHGNRYDYSKVNYVNAKSNVAIICKIHGEFEQTPNSHLTGHNCEKCGNLARGDALRMSREEFINTAIGIHSDKYNYDKVVYTNNSTEVEIFCNKHQSYFWQRPSHHIHRESGCPACAKYGYKRDKPATLYILDCGSFIGFGITNDFNTRIGRHNRNLSAVGIKPTIVETFELDGETVLSIESSFKQKYKDRLTNAKVEGFVTEALDKSDLGILLNHIKENLPEGRLDDAV